MLKSFTEFVNEERQGIFKGDLRVGANRAFINRAKKTTAYRVLEFIYLGGEVGRRYSEIVRFIVEEVKGRPYDWRKDRGYWATQLLSYNDYWGRYESRTGLLERYCDNVDNRYVLKPWAREFFKLESFSDLDVSPDALDFLTKLNAFGE